MKMKRQRRYRNGGKEWTLRSPGILDASASAKSATVWLRYKTVECWRRLVWFTIASTTSGWQWPQHTVAIPPNASRYRRPFSSNKYCIFPSTKFNCPRHKTIRISKSFKLFFQKNGKKEKRKKKNSSRIKKTHRVLEEMEDGGAEITLAFLKDLGGRGAGVRRRRVVERGHFGKQWGKRLSGLSGGGEWPVRQRWSSCR